ncbi:amine oxidase [Hyaloraphidium curvatum]|nr:amine oxidase [Hyaloraphidium curvatum]
MAIESCDVLVLGAGMAGVAAAAKLLGHSSKPKVIVVEARNRVGGRLLNSSAADFPVPPGPFDMGGAWVTGLRGNPLLPLMKELGIEMRKEGKRAGDEGAGKADGEIGKHEDEGRASEGFLVPGFERIPGEEMERAEEAAGAYAERIRAEFGAPGRTLQEAWDMLRAKLEAEGSAPSDAATMLFRMSAELNEGGYLSQMASDGFEAIGEGEFGPEYVLVEGGFASVPQELAKARGVDVRLNEPVGEVIWGGEGAPDGVAFKTVGGKEYRAKAAIVTAPFPVLQSGSIAFNPPLPAAQRDSFSSLPTGTLTKLFLHFPRRFWPADVAEINLVPRDGARIRVPEHWMDAAAAGIASPGGDGAVLLAFTHGDVGLRCETETEAVVAESVAMFREAYGAQAVPDPVRWLPSTWKTDPFSLGAYSFSSVERPGPEVREPAGDRVWLAGEWTGEHHRGYVHGAMLEGERAAGEVLEQVLGK